MTSKLDCIVCGAGVVGLAIGRRLALDGLQVAVIEAEGQVGAHTSSRNSEVIHAGIHYPENSLKARLCVEGKHALYAYCDQRRVAHQRIGKLIVATCRAEEERLAGIDRNAKANGVTDLAWLDTRQVEELEPAVVATRALLSPSTGIIDSHELMLSLQGDLEDLGGAVVLQSCITGVRMTGDGFEVAVDGDVAGSCRVFVNAAGLKAAEVAALVEGLEPPTMSYARGHYFSYGGRSPFSHLVYPVPNDGGLGIHATNDMGGAARFGPDVEWIDEIDYGFPDNLKGRFLEAIRRYFPGVDPNRLTPSYTGIRPRLSGPGEPPADFEIAGPTTHGVDGLVNLYGIESPGLTASLAIADHVCELLEDARA